MLTRKENLKIKKTNIINILHRQKHFPITKFQIEFAYILNKKIICALPLSTGIHASILSHKVRLSELHAMGYQQPQSDLSIKNYKGVLREFWAL